MMKDLNCPHCNQPGISAVRKMFLGPALPTTCNACGKKIGVPYTAILTAVPFLACVYMTGYVEPIAMKAGLWIIGGVIMAMLHIKWVPLEPR